MGHACSLCPRRLKGKKHRALLVPGDALVDESHLTEEGRRAGRSLSKDEATEYTVYSNNFAGGVSSIFEHDDLDTFHTYHARLNFVEEVFEDRWNEFAKDEHHAKIFASNPQGILIRSGLRAEHAALYTEPRACWRVQRGRFRSAEDFLTLLNHGLRDGKRRVYTYAILDSGIYFSETGACMAKDLISKHAVHSSAARRVRFSGTFRLCENEEGDDVFVIDNDSGTYRPDPAHYPELQRLLELNFPGVQVRCLDFTKPQPVETLAWTGPDETDADGNDKWVYPGKWSWQNDDED